MTRAFDLQDPIGRDEELAQADRLLRAVADSAGSPDGHASALLLSGDAGMGKTTLVHALVSRATTLGLGFTVGHCLDLATGPPFGPVVEALRALVRSGGPRRDNLPASAAWLADARPRQPRAHWRSCWRPGGARRGRSVRARLGGPALGRRVGT